MEACVVFMHLGELKVHRRETVSRPTEVCSRVPILQQFSRLNGGVADTLTVTLFYQRVCETSVIERCSSKLPNCGSKIDMPAPACWDSAVPAHFKPSRYKDQQHESCLDLAENLLSACCCRVMQLSICDAWCRQVRTRCMPAQRTHLGFTRS